MKCIPSPSQKDICHLQFMRRNYQLLWEIAEKIKLYQCRLDSANAEQELLLLSNIVQTRLVNDLILMPPDGKVQTDSDVAEAMKVLVEERKYLIPIEEVYHHKIRDQLNLHHGGTTEKSVTEYIQDSLSELKSLAASHNADIDVIVLAGAGCRVPLVEKLVSSVYFPNARIVQDPKRTKFRVAHGLVRFLDASHGGHRFACSSDYSAFAYEVGRPDGHFLITAIPNCAPLRSHQWYRLCAPNPFQDGIDTDVRIDDIMTHDEEPRVYLYQLDENRQRTTYGWFELGSPPAISIPTRSNRLTNEELLSLGESVDVRVIDSENVMELRVNLAPEEFAVWKLVVHSNKTAT